MSTISVILPDYLKHTIPLITSLNSKLSIQTIDWADITNSHLLPKLKGKKWITENLNIYPDSFVVWSGVACGRRLLQIPRNSIQIQENLNYLEGRQHQVIMMIGHMKDHKAIIKETVTRLRFKRLTLHERQEYIADPENWMNRLGGYSGSLKNIRYLKTVNGDPGALFGFSPYLFCNKIKY